MGITDIYKVLEEHAPNSVRKNVPLKILAGYRVAVDVSIFFYKYIRSAGDGWVECFVHFLCVLKSSGLKTICIFDGASQPEEKKQEQERRRAQTQKTVAKKVVAEELLKKINKKIARGDMDISEDFKEECRSVIVKKMHVDITDYDDLEDVATSLKESIDKYERQTIPITDEYRIKAEKMLTYMGMPWIRAIGEAEALCSYLCVGNKTTPPIVDAVLSEDTDPLAYGTRILLSKLDITTQTVCAVIHKDILSEMEMSRDEFTDLCILLGCDYNDRVKGYPPDGKKHKKPVGIGAKGAVCMIQEYRRLEEAELRMIDADPLLYRRCRELFSIPDDIGISDFPPMTPIDVPNLEKFFKDNNCRYSVDYICDLWKPTPITFQE